MQPRAGPDRGDPEGPCPQALVPPGLRSGPTAPWSDTEAIQCLPAGDNFTRAPLRRGFWARPRVCRAGWGGDSSFGWSACERCRRLSPAQPRAAPRAAPIRPSSARFCPGAGSSPSCGLLPAWLRPCPGPGGPGGDPQDAILLQPKVCRSRGGGTPRARGPRCPRRSRVLCLRSSVTALCLSQASGASKRSVRNLHFGGK